MGADQGACVQGQGASVTAANRRALRKNLRTPYSPTVKWWRSRVTLRVRQAAHVPALLRGATLDRPVFIIGAPRSGTSMLYSILRSSSRLAHWGGEAHEVWESDYHPSLRGWESNVLDASDLSPASAARIRRDFFLATGSRRRFIDKTPRNVLRVPFIEALFPDARYVFLKRDGRDNVNSLINAWRVPRYRTYELPEPHSIPGVESRWWKFMLYPGWRQDVRGPLEVVCAKQWQASYDHALTAFEDIDEARRVDIRYEELVERPVEEIGRLMRFLDLPLEEGVRERAEAAKTKAINYVTLPERGKWRRENPLEIEAIIPLIAPTMSKLGDPLDRS
jgi:hypothetical protein